MATIAVYDACVLYPAALRDFLLRLATDFTIESVMETLRGDQRKKP